MGAVPKLAARLVLARRASSFQRGRFSAALQNAQLWDNRIPRQGARIGRRIAAHFLGDHGQPLVAAQRS